MEGDILFFGRSLIELLISIHALRVEGDLDAETQNAYRGLISIHALRVEGDNGT